MISDDQIEIINLFDILIKDMYNILVKILPEDLPKAKTEIFNRLTSEETKNINIKNLENRPYFMFSIVDYILNEKEENGEITNNQLYEFIKLFLDSAVLLNKKEREFDKISKKNI